MALSSFEVIQNPVSDKCRSHLPEPLGAHGEQIILDFQVVGTELVDEMLNEPGSVIGRVVADPVPEFCGRAEGAAVRTPAGRKYVSPDADAGNGRDFIFGEVVPAGESKIRDG